MANITQLCVTQKSVIFTK